MRIVTTTPVQTKHVSDFEKIVSFGSWLLLVLVVVSFRLLERATLYVRSLWSTLLSGIRWVL